MATNVYAWPPVGTVGTEWTEIAPINQSTFYPNGKRFISATERKKRAATLVVSSLANGRNGAGYCEVLKRYLEGGVSLVRLYSNPINWYLDVAATQAYRQSYRLEWSTGGNPLAWTTGGSPLAWFTGSIIYGTRGTDAGGFPIVTVPGLPANTLVARPGEFLTCFETSADTTGETVMIANEATTNASGVAVIRLFTALTFDGRVSIGTQDTGVFKVVGELPRSTQPMGADWQYVWNFEEVFSDQAGGFTEVDPWT